MRRSYRIAYLDWRKLTRQLLLVTVASALTALAIALSAQEPRVSVLGVLTGATGPNDRSVIALRASLKELGYEEGRNLRIEFRTAQGHYDRLPGLVADLVQLKPDVIVVGNETGAQLLKRATSTIPVVFVNITDPVGSGLAKSLSRPGGNLTGLSSMAAELITKRLELLKEAFPKVTRVTVLRNPTVGPSSGYNTKLIEQLRSAAPSMGVELNFVEARRPDDFVAAFRRISEAHRQAVYVAECALCYSERKKIVQLAAQARTPAIYVTRAFSDDGGLMSYGVDYTGQARRAAVYVDKILRGAKPGDLPIEQPTKVEFVVNLATAKAIGISIPESILAPLW